MAIVGEAFVRLRPDPTGFGAEAERGVTSSLSSIAAKGAAILGGIFAVGAATKGLVDLADAGQQLTKQQNLVTAALFSTGDAAGVTVPQLKEIAESQAAITGNSAGAVTQLEQIALRFTNVRNEAGKGNDIFNQSITAAQNLSAALGKGLQPSMIALGKALQEPGKGFTSLQRFGIQFSDSEKEQIKTLVAHHDALDAQKIILGELSKRFGDAAAASATFTDKLKASLANAKGEIGQALTPAVAAITSGLLPVIPQITEVIAGAFNAVIPAVVPILRQLGPVLSGVISGLAPVLAQIGGTVAKVLGGLAPAFKAFGSLVGSLAPVLRPIGDILGTIAQAAGAVLTPALDGLVGIFSTLAQTVLPPIADALKSLTPLVIEAAHIFGDTFGSVLDELDPVLGQIAGLLAGALADALHAIGPLLPDLVRDFSQLVALGGDVGVALLKALIPALTAVLNAVQPLIPSLAQIASLLVGQLSTAINTVAPFIAQLATALGQAFAQAIEALIPVLPSLADALGKIGVALADVLTAVTPLLPPLVELATTLITNIGAPALVAIATAFTAVANALVPIVANVNVLTPLLAALAAAWAVEKITAFGGAIIRAGIAIGDFLVSLDFSRITGFIAQLVGIGTASEVAGAQQVASAAAFVTAQNAAVAALGERVGAEQALVVAQGEALAAQQLLVEATAGKLAADQALAGIQGELAGALALTDEQTAALATAQAAADSAAVDLATAQQLVALSAAKATVAQGTLTDAIAAEGIAAEGAAAAAETSGGIIAALGGPVTLIAAAVVALGVAVFEAYQHIKPFRDAVDATGRALAGIAGSIISALTSAFNWVRDHWQTIVELIAFPFVGLPIFIAQHLGGVLGAFVSFGASVGSSIVGALGSLGSTILGAIASAATSVASSLPGLFVSTVQFFAQLPFRLAIAFAGLSGFVVGAVARAFVDLVRALPGLVSDTVNFFNSLPGRIASALVSLGSVLIPIGQEAIDGFVGALESGLSAVDGFFQALPGHIASVATSIFSAVASVFAALPGQISAAASSAFDALVSALSTIGTTAASGFVTGLSVGVSSVRTFFERLPGVLVAAAGDASQWLKSLGNDVIAGLTSGILTAAKAVGNFFVDVVDAFVDGFKRGFGISSPATVMMPLGEEIINGLIAGARAVLGNILSFLAGLPAQFIGAMSSLGSTFLDFAESAFSDLVRGFTQSLPQLLSFFTGIGSQIIAAVGNIESQMLQVGQDIVTGIIQGLGDVGSSILSHITSGLGSVVDGVKSFLGIGSPSRLMAEQVGAPMAQGIAQGIVDQTPTIVSAVKNAVGAAASVDVGGLFNFGPTTFTSEQEAAVQSTMAAFRTRATEIAKAQNVPFEFNVQGVPQFDKNNVAKGLGGTAIFANIDSISPQVKDIAAQIQQLFPELNKASAGGDEMAQALGRAQGFAQQLGVTGGQAINSVAVSAISAAQGVENAADAVLGARNAQSQFFQSIQQVTGALGTMSATLNIQTEAGRNNDQALQSAAQAALTYTQQQQAAGATVDAVQRQLGGQVDQLDFVTHAFGLSGDAAIQYVGSLFKIPPSVLTNIHNDADLKKIIIQQYTGAINSVPTTHTTQFVVDDNGAKAEIDAFGRKLITAQTQFGSIAIAIPVVGKVNPTVPFDQVPAAIATVLSNKISSTAMPALTLAVTTPSLPDLSPIAAAQAATFSTAFASSLFADPATVAAARQRLANLTAADAAAQAAAAAQQSAAAASKAALDQIVSTATSALPTVTDRVNAYAKNAAAAYANVGKAGETLSKAQAKLVADEHASSAQQLFQLLADQATLQKAEDKFNADRSSKAKNAAAQLFRDQAAINDAQARIRLDTAIAPGLAKVVADQAAVAKDQGTLDAAQQALQGATNPASFIANLNAQNKEIAGFQHDLAVLLSKGDTALAQSLAQAGPTAAKALADALAHNATQAAAANAAIITGQKFTDSFTNFIQTKFAPQAASAVSGAVTTAVQTGSAPSVTVPVSASLASPSVNPALAASAPTGVTNPSITLDITLVLEDGQELRIKPVTIPPPPTAPGALVQQVVATVQAQ